MLRPFERVRGWLWPVGAIAAAGVAVVAIVVVVAVMFWSGPGSEHTVRIWAASISADGVFAAFEAGHPADAHVFPGTYNDPGGIGPAPPAWSPNGDYLAALRGDPGEDPGVVMFTHRGDEWSAGAVVAAPTEYFSWSPDSELLGVLGQQSRLVAPSGQVIAQFDIPPNPRGSGQPLALDHISWSPGHTHAFAAGAMNQLIVLGPDGGHAYRPPGGGEWTTYPVGWSDPQTIMVVAMSAPSPAISKAYAVHINGAIAQWDELTGAAATPSAPVLPTPDAAIVSLWHNPTWGVAAYGKTRDGSGIVYGPDFFGATIPAQAIMDFQMIVRTADGQTVPVDLGVLNMPQPAYDIVITK